MNLKSKVALITGASQRIGAAIADILAEQGVSIALHYHHSQQAAEQTLSKLSSLNKSPSIQHQSFSADLCDFESIKKLICEVQSTMGHVSILINNASVFYPTPIESVTETQWDHFHNLNLKAPFFLSQELAPLMRQVGEGKIINIADTNLNRPRKRFLPYAISKAGLITLSKGLARVYAPQIQANAIAPGPSTDTSSCAKEINETYLDRTKQTLLQRLGTPQEVANAVLYLVKSDFITGSLLTVDGGTSLV